jgi:hypothetical protein
MTVIVLYANVFKINYYVNSQSLDKVKESLVWFGVFVVRLRLPFSASSCLEHGSVYCPP